VYSRPKDGEAVLLTLQKKIFQNAIQRRQKPSS
jgi:hypothetical protein